MYWNWKKRDRYKRYKTEIIGLKLQGVKYGYCFLCKQGCKWPTLQI